jgi:hypothetical protein
MKKIIFFAVVSIFLFGLSIFSAEAAVRVRGYYKPSFGTFVMPHYRSNPDSSRFNNWSAKGNYNLFTGKKGYASPFKLYKW